MKKFKVEASNLGSTGGVHFSTLEGDLSEDNKEIELFHERLFILNRTEESFF